MSRYSEPELRDELTVLLSPPAPSAEVTHDERERINARLARMMRREMTAESRRTRVLDLIGPTVVTAAAAAVAVWVAVAVTSQTPSRSVDRARPIAATPAAVTVLYEASQAALAHDEPGESMADDQFAYTRSIVISNEGAFGDPPSLGTPHEREIWLSQDPGPIDEVGLIREFGQDWPMSAGTPSPPSVVRPTFDWLDTLPTDPDELLVELESDVAIGQATQDREQVIFNRVGTLVGEGLVPPQVTAALFRAVMRIPGVRTIAGAEDALGRTGIGVSRQDTMIRSVWIFNPRTYEILGTRDYFLVPGPDILLRATAVVERGIAPRAGEAPNMTSSQHSSS